MLIRAAALHVSALGLTFFIYSSVLRRRARITMPAELHVGSLCTYMYEEKYSADPRACLAHAIARISGCKPLLRCILYVSVQVPAHLELSSCLGCLPACQPVPHDLQACKAANACAWRFQLHPERSLFSRVSHISVHLRPPFPVARQTPPSASCHVTPLASQLSPATAARLLTVRRHLMLTAAAGWLRSYQRALRSGYETHARGRYTHVSQKLAFVLRPVPTFWSSGLACRQPGYNASTKASHLCVPRIFPS